MKQYSTIKVRDKTFVLTRCHRAIGYRDANFQNTNLALCGILLSGESLRQWKRRIQVAQIQRESEDLQRDFWHEKYKIRHKNYQNKHGNKNN